MSIICVVVIKFQHVLYMKHVKCTYFVVDIHVLLVIIFVGFLY